MSPTTGYATKEELAQVKHDLSKRLADVELSVKMDIGRLHSQMDERFTQVESRFDQINDRFVQMMAALIPIYQALGIDTDQLSQQL